MAEKKRKIAFGFIDVLILLAVVAVLVVFSFYASGKWEDNNGGKAAQTMTYTVEVSNVDKDVAEQFKKGDALRDSRKDTAIGTITEVKGIDPYKAPTTNEENGTYVMSERPGKYTVTFEVKSAYQQTGNDVKISDVDVKVGSNLIVKGQGYAASALIVGVNR